jgi:1-acyl-sn-glycerol-3-phosphate acyltransferase
MNASIAVSLRNVYETLAISAPTVVDAVLGRVSKAVCDERLDHWSRACLRHARIVLEVSGREHIGAHETYLVMSNHQSLYDIPVLFQVVGPNIRMITKKELFRVPVFGGALEASGFIAIDRTNRNAAIRSCSARRTPGERNARLDRPGGHAQPDRGSSALQEGGILPGARGGASHLACHVSRAPGERCRPARFARSSGARVRVTIHERVDPRPFAARGKPGRAELMDHVRRCWRAPLSASATVSRWPPAGVTGLPGAGLAILVNANAKRGGRRVAVQIDAPFRAPAFG